MTHLDFLNFAPQVQVLYMLLIIFTSYNQIIQDFPCAVRFLKYWGGAFSFTFNSAVNPLMVPNLLSNSFGYCWKIFSSEGLGGLAYSMLLIVCHSNLNFDSQSLHFPFSDHYRQINLCLVQVMNSGFTNYRYDMTRMTLQCQLVLL